MNDLVVRKKAEPLSSFETLVRQVKETLLRGKERIERAWIETYWQTGRRIHEHISRFKGRAERYGREVILRLARQRPRRRRRAPVPLSSLLRGLSKDFLHVEEIFKLAAFPGILSAQGMGRTGRPPLRQPDHS